MKKIHVEIIIEAQLDMLEIYDYVAHMDSVTNANKLFDKLESLCLSLENFPECGHALPELERLAITAYREIHFKPYRVIYQIRDQYHVSVHCVLDGRRNLEQLLLQRLLKK